MLTMTTLAAVAHQANRTRPQKVVAYRPSRERALVRFTLSVPRPPAHRRGERHQSSRIIQRFIPLTDTGMPGQSAFT